MKKIITICPYCYTGSEIYFKVENNRIIGAEAYVRNIYLKMKKRLRDTEEQAETLRRRLIEEVMQIQIPKAEGLTSLRDDIQGKTEKPVLISD